MPEREKAIGRRLREARERHGLHRTALAVKLGIGTERLASYESGRAPLPWVVGERFCDVMFVGQTWLATGAGGWDHYFPWRFDPPPPLQAKFSEIHDAHLLQEIKKAKAVLPNVATKRGALSLKVRLAVQRVIRDSEISLTPAQQIRIMAAYRDIVDQLMEAETFTEKLAAMHGRSQSDAISR